MKRILSQGARGGAQQGTGMRAQKINGWPLTHVRMQSALAEMSIEDASKDLDDDVEFIDVMGMYGSI